MTAPAPAAEPVAHLLKAYAAHCRTLGLSSDGYSWRMRHARALLASHPDLGSWMARPLDARLADIRRTKAWPLVCWAVLSVHARADIDLLVARRLRGLHKAAEALFPDDFTVVREAAKRLGWQPRWAEQVIAEPLSLAVAWCQRPPGQLTDADIDALGSALEASPALGAAARDRQRRNLGRLRRVLYEARILDQAPIETRRCARGVSGYLDRVAAPEIRRVMAAYLETRAAVLRPGTVAGLANDLGCFGEFLAARHPEVASLAALERTHVESFCAWVPTRPWRGRKPRDRQIHASAAAHAVISVRNFLDDITAWGWAEAPRRTLLFASDVPRQPKALPRALSPDVDAALMAAVANLDDVFARDGLTVIRGTGLRAGELVDLELGCVIDYGASGSWLRVPLGKLATERSVPLDPTTLAALDEWVAHRGPQRPLPHPRSGRMVDFLFVEHGRRFPTSRLRRGLATAAQAAGLHGPDGTPLRVVPHQLRHTYASSLANAGMSLQALMALLGHRSPDMTLRYAALASPTLRKAYDEAVGKLRRSLPLVFPAGRPAVPERVEWLRSEMLKTRVAHGYCSRDLVAEACPYANICENCSNFVTTPEFVPALEAQLGDVQALRDDAEGRGWTSEVARHERVIASIEGHLRRLTS